MNALDSLYLRHARQHLTDFDRESVLLLASSREQRESLDRWDVDAILQMGIDAFDWLTQADNVGRQLLYDGKLTDAEVAQAETGLVLLFTSWLRSCGAVNQRIAQALGQGYDLENLESFRKCEREVRSIVRHYGDSAEPVLPMAMQKLRDEALADHGR